MLGGKIGKDTGLLGVLEGGKIGKGVSLDDGVTLGEGTRGARAGETNGLCMPDFADTLIVTFWPASQWVIAPSIDLLQEKQYTPCFEGIHVNDPDFPSSNTMESVKLQ